MNIGLISVTLNAVEPMMQATLGTKLQITNYLDEGLQALVRKESGVTDQSEARIIGLINRAVQDGAEAVLLTCTVFTPIIDRLQTQFSVPIISADGAMLEQAVKLNKRTAILCTFPASIQSSFTVFQSIAASVGLDSKPDMFLLEDAAKASKEGDKELHDRLIAKKAVELSNQYDVIVLAQISMSHAESYLQDIKATVLTSPKSAVDKILKL